MDCDREDCEQWLDLNPLQSIEISHLWVSKTEVTYDQYQRCIDAQVCEAFDFYSEQNSLPIRTLSFEQAHTFAQWVGGRLPTAEEWSALAMWEGSFVERLESQSPQEVCSNETDINSFGVCDIMDSSVEWTVVDGQGEARGCDFESTCEYPAYYRWPSEERDQAGVRVVR